MVGILPNGFRVEIEHPGPMIFEDNSREFQAPTRVA